MALTKIEWTATKDPNQDGHMLPGYSFNPWSGCTKVSEGCKHCYAETIAERFPGNLGEWGPNGVRRIAGEDYWGQPLRWNARAQKEGNRRRVFCASMADVFEDRLELHIPRARLFSLITKTPCLDWLLLTKRPENVHRLIREAMDVRQWLPDIWFPCLNWLKWLAPRNVWIGTSTENQETADARIPHLLATPAAIRFLSAEPLRGPLNIRDYLASGKLHWVIAGGESGPGARPCHPDWARGLRDQCREAGVPFFFKQWGAWKPYSQMSEQEVSSLYHPAPKRDPDTTRRCRVPTYLMQYDGANGYHVRDGHGVIDEFFCVGKKMAGRMLDGREWNEFPASPSREQMSQQGLSERRDDGRRRVSEPVRR